MCYPILVFIQKVSANRDTSLRNHVIQIVSSSQSWYSVNHLLHFPLAGGLILQLLRSPFGNRNFLSKTKQNITTEGMMLSVVSPSHHRAMSP